MVHGAVMAHRAGTSADRIVFLGHATFLIEMDGVRLLTDPLLRDRVAHLRRQVPPIDPSVLAGRARRGGRAGTDAVLISHLHRDHLDLASLRLLGLDTPLLAPAGAGAWLRRLRFTNVTELSAGAVANVGGLSVTATEARHDGRRQPWPGGPRAETLGYVVSGRRKVYFAGDTELFEGMSGLAPRPADDTASRRPTPDLHGRPPTSDLHDMPDRAPRLDVALLPVAGWGTTLGPGHMDPLDAARAVSLLRPRIAIPMHWGTLLPIGVADRHRAQLGDPPRLFAEHVASLASSVEVRILMPGQETTL
jgi:L-ascorbate metabolism protein UlaG (beta-lactamase superfamily)